MVKICGYHVRSMGVRRRRARRVRGKGVGKLGPDRGKNLWVGLLCRTELLKRSSVPGSVSLASLRNS